MRLKNARSKIHFAPYIALLFAVGDSPTRDVRKNGRTQQEKPIHGCTPAKTLSMPVSNAYLIISDIISAPNGMPPYGVSDFSTRRC